MTEGLRPLPPRIENACNRIEQAVADIEASLAQRDEMVVHESGREDDMERILAENAALRDSRDEVTRRLDAAIQRVQQLLRG